MQLKPVWLLDVDGVVNAPRPPWPGRISKSFAVADGQKFEMRYASGLVDRIRAVHEEGLAELRWCTTWNPWADQLESMWGLPVLARTAADIPSGPAGDLVKHSIAANICGSGSPLVWTDDTAIPSLPVGHPAKMVRHDVLLVAPNARAGLSPLDMQAIDTFLGRQT